MVSCTEVYKAVQDLIQVLATAGVLKDPQLEKLSSQQNSSSTISMQ